MGNFHPESLDELHSLTEWEDLDQPELGLDREALDQAKQVHEFLERTPDLSASEQAELVGAVVELDFGESDFGAIARGIQTGLSLFQTGAQIAGGLSATFGGNNRTARDFSRWANLLGQGAGVAGGVLGSFRGMTGGSRGPTRARPQRRPLTRPTTRSPTRPPARRPAPRPAARPPTRPPATRPATRLPAPGARPAAPGGSRLNATALMGLLMNNPQLMQALRSAPFIARAGARRVEVDIPGREVVSIPLGDVMNSIALLARESMHELNALASEDNEETFDYLIGADGEFRVDPASATERAEETLYLLRIGAEADRYADAQEFVTDDVMEEVVGDLDESDLWAAEAGFNA